MKSQHANARFDVRRGMAAIRQPDRDPGDSHVALMVRVFFAGFGAFQVAENAIAEVIGWCARHGARLYARSQAA